MKRFVIVLLFVVPQLSFSQRALTDEQWIQDLAFMMNRLDSVHPGLYANSGSNILEESALKLKESIPSLSDDEITVELLRIITLVEDGHTRLHGTGLTKKWYPLRLERFSDGYFITAIAAVHSSFIGARVLAINDKPVEEVFDMLNDITPHDNIYGRDYFAPMYLTMSSLLAGLHITESADDSLTVSVRTKQNRDDVLILYPADFHTGDDLSWFWKDYAAPADEYANILNADTVLPLCLQRYNQPFWYEYIKDHNTVYFAFNECVDDEVNDFESFNSKLWRCIDSVKAGYLVIDLRNNFGGTNSHIMPLVHDIIRHDSINSKGHLFVITGKKTFSAALDCAAWIEFHCKPVFVGEPSGAGPNHYADPDFSLLPNSRILLMISKYFWQDSWPWDNRKYIEPAIKISMSSADYFNYHDPALEEIFRYIRQTP